MVTEKYRQRKALRSLQRKAFNNESLINKNHDCKCLVILHLFYDNSWEEINEYLKNLSPYHFDLFITVTRDLISQKTIDCISREYPAAKITVTENRGYDLLPFFTVLKNIDLDQYDIVFKLHSKSTKRRFIYIYRQFFLRRDWFINLYAGILSAKNVHKTIDILYNQKETGLVAASNLIVQDPKHKQNLIRKIAEKQGYDFWEGYYFVAGTCFAIKAQCLKPIQAMHFENADFSPVASSRGMSFAHFIERYICISVHLQGYLIKGNSANVYRRMLQQPIVYVMNHFSSERLHDEDVELDDEWFYWKMDNRLITYKYDDVKFSDMTCDLGNRIFKFTDGVPYKYIKEGDSESYEAYCKLHKDSGLPLMSKERYDRLISSIKANGYNNKNIIIVNEDNVIMDGQHRACILADKYGEDASIRVLKICDIKRHIRKRLKAMH